EGKLAYISELLELGMLNNEQAQELLEFPDIQRFTELRLATRDAAKKKVDDILNEGIYKGPTEFDDLAFCLEYAKSNYNKADSEGIYPEEHLRMLRQFIAELDAMLASLEAPPAPPPGAPETDPMAGL